MKELIESTRKLQGEIQKCISRLVTARSYHDNIEEAWAIAEMERLIVCSSQQMQCHIDKLESLGIVENWQTGEPEEEGRYLVVFQFLDCKPRIDITDWSKTLGWNAARAFKIISWRNLEDINPYKEVEEQP